MDPGGRAEFGALVPIIFAEDVAIEPADLVYRLVGGSFAAFGLVAWQRRPDSRSGPLMTATGFGFFVSRCSSRCTRASRRPPAIVLQDLWTPFFVALILSFVTGGRLETSIDRLIVATAFIVVFVVDVFSMLFVEQPGNVLLTFPNEEIASVIDTAQRSMLIVLALAVCVVVGQRWERRRAGRRRALPRASPAASACFCSSRW